MGDDAAAPDDADPVRQPASHVGIMRSDYYTDTVLVPQMQDELFDAQPVEVVQI